MYKSPFSATKEDVINKGKATILGIDKNTEITISNEDDWFLCERCGKPLSSILRIPGDKILISCDNIECEEERKNRYEREELEEEKAARRKYLEELPKEVEANPQRYLPEYGISKYCLSHTLENFYGYEKHIIACRNYIENPEGNLLFTGNCGSGKTHMATAILRELVKKDKTDIYFINTPKLMLELRNSFKNNCYENEYSIISKYTSTGLLVLDDLGAEKSSEYVISSLYILIDQRIQQKKSTIITTNLSLEQIEKEFGSRIASRLASFKVWKFDMPDYRKKRIGNS